MNTWGLSVLLSFWVSTGSGAGDGGGFLLRGPDALFANPALLAYHPTTSFRLLSLNLEVSNNAFSVDDYNNLVGDTLDNTEKEALLSKVPKGGWAFTSRIQVGGLEGTLGNFGFSFRGLSSFRVALPRDLLQLILYGNPVGSQYTFTTGPQYLLGVMGLTFAYARSIHLRQFPYPLYVGMGLRLLKGIVSAEFNLSQALLATTETGINTIWEGKTAFNGILARSLGDLAKSGDTLPPLGSFGFGLDLGVIYQPSENWVIGAALVNLNTGVEFAMEEQWGRFALEGYRLIRRDTLEPDTATEVRYPITYRFPVPGHLSLSVAYRGLVHHGVDLAAGLLYEFGFPFESPPPYLGIGVEFHKLSFLPLRLHLGFGGRNSFELGAGLGIRIWRIGLLNIGAGFLRGLGTGSRGLKLGLDLLSYAP